MNIDLTAEQFAQIEALKVVCQRLADQALVAWKLYHQEVLGHQDSFRREGRSVCRDCNQTFSFDWLSALLIVQPDTSESMQEVLLEIFRVEDRNLEQGLVLQLLKL